MSRRPMSRREKITIRTFLNGKNDRGVTPQTGIPEASRRNAFAGHPHNRELVQNDKAPGAFLVLEPAGTVADGEHRIARPCNDFVDEWRLSHAPGCPDSEHFWHGTDRAWRKRAASPVSVKISDARRSKIHDA